MSTGHLCYSFSKALGFSLSIKMEMPINHFGNLGDVKR